MSNAEEVFRDNYIVAWWYAYGRSENNMAIATDFANYYALARMENAKGPAGIPESFDKWILNGAKPYTTLLPE